MQTGTQDGIDPVKTSEVLTTVMQAFCREERLFVILHHGERLETSDIASIMRCPEQHVLDTLTGIEDRVRQAFKRELSGAR